MDRPTGKQIRESVQYWRTVLGLEDWTYTIQIGRLPGGDYGSAEVDVPYKRAHFRFWPKGIVEAGDDHHAVALHEWLHCLVEPLAAKALSLAKAKDREAVSDLEESLTTDLDRLVLRLHRRG